LAATSGSTAQGNVTFTTSYDRAEEQQILAAQAPILEIVTASGVSRISPVGVFDTKNGRVTVSVPRGVLDGATSVKLYLAIDAPLAAQSYGPRYWNGSAWTAQPIALDPNKRTVVMVHGVFSSVESAFGCEQSIMAAGGYGQAVGIDYDWTQPPYAQSGGTPALVNFVNSLPVATVDIEAHSYGTVNALAALPQIQKKVGNVVLLGGPLPLGGAPQADPGFLRDLVLLGAFVASPSQVYAAYSSGMLASLATNSPTMQQIAAGLAGLSLPPFVQVAGGSPLPQETSHYAIEFLYTLLYGGTTNDGVVEQQSALTQFPTTTHAITFLSLDHEQLECDPAVVPWVGQYVRP
jgi:pimeloyl-ACP methyl ester carboxylesterase